LGVIEGLTEFLPVSSTAHLLLASHLMGIAELPFVKTFDIAIQSGAMLAVVVLYWKDLFLHRSVLLRILVAFLVTGILGFLLHNIVKNVFFESTSLILWSLGIGGILLIIFDLLFRERESAIQEIGNLPLWKAAVIGACQAIAVVPGVSRAASTIVGGLLLGVSRKAIVPFSFLLAVPTILAATVLDIAKSTDAFASADLLPLLTGTVISFAVALLAIRLLSQYFQRGSLLLFGCYRILIALLFAFLLTP
jgi:undecaprenyl-diphosphatase